MTTQKYLCSGKTIKETVFQSKYFMILHLIVLFLASAFSSIIQYNSLAMSMDDIKYRSWRSIEDFLAISGGTGMIIATAVGLITAYLMFSFLFNKNSVVFYHSMPYKRSNIFISRYISGIITMAIPLLIELIINTVIYMYFKNRPPVASDELFAYSTLVKGFLLTFLQYIVVFSVGAFSACISGNIFAMAGISALVFLITPVTLAVIEANIDQWFVTYMFNFNYDVYKFFPPSMCLEFLRGNVSSGIVIYAIFYALVFALSGLVLYIYRKSEHTNKFFSYKVVGNVLKYYITAIITLGFGMVFITASGNNTITTYIGYILVSFIIFSVSQAVIDMNFKNMFKNIKGYAVFCVIFLAVVTIPMLDVFGLDAKIPDRESIEKIEITRIATVYRRGSFTNTLIPLEERENIDAVYDFMKNSIPYTIEADKSRTYPKDSEAMTIRINDGGFFDVKRHLRYTKSSDRDELLAKLYESNEYRKELSINTENMTWMSVSKGNITKHSTEMKAGETKKLIEAFNRDVLNTSYEDVKNSYTYARVYIDSTSESKRIYRQDEMLVLSCYEETIKVIDEILNLDDHINATVKAVLPGTGKMITDKDQIAELIKRGESSGEEVRLYHDDIGYTSVFIDIDSLPSFAK